MPHTTLQPRTQGSMPSRAPSEFCLSASRLRDNVAEQGRANVEALDAPHDTAAKDAGLDPLTRTK